MSCQAQGEPLRSRSDAAREDDEGERQKRNSNRCIAVLCCAVHAKATSLSLSHKHTRLVCLATGATHKHPRCSNPPLSATPPLHGTSALKPSPSPSPSLAGWWWCVARSILLYCFPLLVLFSVVSTDDKKKRTVQQYACNYCRVMFVL